MKNYIISLCIVTLLISCSSTSNSLETGNQDQTPEWLIPLNEVRDGGPGKDGIPSIDNPQFTNANNVDFLNDEDLVVGILNNNEVKAYPHIILDWHEVVNDDIGGNAITINYCPLTGTAFGWNSMVNDNPTTFGVSGLLYNANLILYDRKTDSNWSQIALKCVNGSLINETPTLTQVIETNWKTWKALYPNSSILNTQTGFSRTYGESPYGNYATVDDWFIFRPSIINDALPNKERVYAIIENNETRVFQLSKFGNGKAIKETFKGIDLLIIGNRDLVHAFEVDEDKSNLNFEYAFNNSGETFFKDNEGNDWNIFGNAISGPRTGETLTPARSVISYWFAIAAFYPNPSIYETP